MTARTRLGLSSVAAALLFASAAHAQTAPAAPPSGPTVAFNVGVASDYVFRGVSQTDEKPEVFGGVDVAQGLAYGGVWASNVDFNDKTKAEVDLYGGVKPEAYGWTFDLGAIAYLYPGAPKGADDNYVEAKIAASRAFGPATLGAALYYSPDFFGAAEDEATYVELNGAYVIREGLSVSGAVGHQQVSSNADYTTWNAGVNWAFAPKLSVDLRYYDTDADAFGDLYKGRAVASLKAVF